MYILQIQGTISVSEFVTEKKVTHDLFEASSEAASMLIILVPACPPSSQNTPSGRFLLCTVMHIWTTIAGQMYLSISMSISKPAPALNKNTKKKTSLNQVCGKTKQISSRMTKRYLLPIQEYWQLVAAFHFDRIDIFQRNSQYKWNRKFGYASASLFEETSPKK